MNRKSIQLGFFIVVLAASAAAQTTTNVTNTDNGTTNVVPVYTGAATVTNSTIYASGGNVGIKTSPTAGLLELSAPDQSTESAIAIRQSNNLNDGFDFGISQSTGMGYLYAVSGTTSNPTKTALEQFDPVNNYVLFEGGDVGIGTTAPAHPLDVNGQVNATGYCIAGANCITAWPAVSGISPSNGEVGSITFADGTVQSTAVGSSQGCIGGDGVGGQPAGAAIAGLVLNVICLKNNESDTRSYQIAVLPASAVTTADHLHLLVDTNYTWGSLGHSYIDAFFANRNGFSYQYTVRGAPVTGNSTLQAYQNSNGTVSIYLVLAANAYSYASYTVLENIQETVIASPTNVGPTPPGALVFDASNASYPPATFMGFSGDVGVGTSVPDKPLTVNGGIHLNMPGGIDWTSNQSLLITNSVDAAAGDTGAQIWHGDGGAAGSHTLVFSSYPQTSAALTGGYMMLNTATGNLNVSGKIQPSGGVVYPDGNTQTIAWTGVLCGGDYAEAMNTASEKETYEPGDLLVLAADGNGAVSKSQEAYSTLVAGVYATKPGVIGRRASLLKDAGEVPMAMVGVVPAKVTAENGPIKLGDLLVTSTIPGYAMKGTDRSRMLGAVVGKAMSSLDSGTGVIEVLVTLQ